MELVQFLTDLLREGGTLGVVSWGVTALILSNWKPEPSNDAKRILSIVIPCVLILGAYLLGVLLGSWALEANSLFLALKTLAVELSGSKLIFTATKKAQNMGEKAGTP